MEALGLHPEWTVFRDMWRAFISGGTSYQKDRRTDGWTDGRTDGHGKYISVFFPMKKALKSGNLLIRCQLSNNIDILSDR